MGECTERRFQSLLHAYELGMLSEDERRELELHLLDCATCRENVRQFQASMRLMRQDSEIRDAVRDISEEPIVVSAQVPASRPRRQWRYFPAVVPMAIVTIAVIFLLVLKPWQIELKPTQEATAAHNRLAIMYFDNVVDPQDRQRLGEILTDLLIIDLAESHYIQVVSSQRLYDILKLLGREGIKTIDRETASQVAKRAAADWMLMGSILQIEPQLVLTAQLVDVRTGNAIASQRVMGGKNENIFSVIDQLSSAVKEDLALPAAARQEKDRPVAEVTTHSPDAYRYYVEGMENANKYYNKEAREALLKALSYDSTFAMAYFILAYHIDTSYIHKAVQYAENASKREQYLIHSFEAYLRGDFSGATEQLKELLKRYPDEKEAWFRLGDYYYLRLHYDEALSCFKKAIEIDPLYTITRIMEAYTYSRMNLIDKALAAIDTCISLAPNEANPFDTRGDILAEHGRFEDAAEAYSQAIRVKPDFIASHLKLGYLFNQLGDYRNADYHFNRVTAIGSDTTDSGPGFYNSYVPLRQGKFDEAIRMLDRVVAENTCPDSSLLVSSVHRLKSYILAYTGRCAPAIAEVDKYIGPTMAAAKWNTLMRLEAMMAVTVCAKCGDYNRAEQIAEKLRTMASTDFPLEAYYEFARGTIELEKGNVGAAIAYLEPAVAGQTFSFSEHFMLAQAYMAAKRYRDAAAEYERIVSMFSDNHSFLSIWSVKSYYSLGIAYEELGQPDKAIERFEKFLDIWKNADPGISEITDAKDRLARLKSRS